MIETNGVTKPLIKGAKAGSLRSGKAVRDRRERRFQLRTQALQDRDDRNSDAGRDEAILDGGCARLIFQKPHDKRFHCAPLRVHT